MSSRRRPLLVAAALTALVACLDLPVAPPLDAPNAVRCSPEDAFEGNDSPSRAAEVPAGIVQGLICRLTTDVAGGLDYFLLRGDADSLHRAWLEAPAAESIAELRLFDDSTGTVVVADFDGNYRMPASGRLLAVVHLCCAPAGDSLPYTLVLSDQPNRAPVPAFTVSPATPFPGEAVTLTSNATDPDGDSIPVRRWDLGDGRTLTGVAPSTSWPTTGTYTVTHVVADQWGRADSSSQDIAVVAPVATVEVTPPAGLLVAIGDSLPLTAIARDSVGLPLTGITIAWSTLDTAVASVTPSGVVIARSNGIAVVRADAFGATATATITVQQRIARIVVMPGSLAFGSIGSVDSLARRAEDARGVTVNGFTAVWISLDTAVAGVDPTGRVTARTPGVTVVRITMDTAVTDVSVVVAPVVATVVVSPLTDTLTSIGDSLPLAAIARDSGGTPVAGATIAWSTTDTMVARVTPSGIVVAQANGVAIMRATALGVTGTAAITVRQRIARVVTTPDSLAFGSIGSVDSLALAAEDARGATASGFTPVWMSLDTTVATVDPAGRVTARAPGVTAVRVTMDTVVTDVPVVVAPVVATVEVTPTSATIVALTDSVLFTAVARDSGGTPVAGASIAWSSGATGVATIDPDGWVHPVANGNTLVTATANGIIATGSVTVAIASPGTFTLIASPDTALIPPPYTAEPVLSARVVDEFGATVPGRTFTWRFLNYASDYSLVSLGAPGEDSVRVTPPYYGASGRRILLVEVTSDVLADTVVVFLYAPRQWLSIAAGRAHTCGAVYSDVNPGETEVYCWGDNSRAQLGQPASVTDSPLPVRVPFDSLGFTSLSAGDDFTCGRGNGSLVHCWGSNEFGQLGGASAESCAGVDCSHDAIRVGSTVAAVISAGPEHACLGIPQVFIFGSGTPPEIHCWGRNQGGQLGLDSVATAFSSSPGQVAGLPVVGGIQSVSAFGATSCAVIGGRRYCWGRNGAGQYGMATTTSSPVPVGSPVPTSSLLDYDLEGGDAFQCGNVYVTGDSFGLLSYWGSDALGQTGLAASFPRDTCGTGSTFPCVTTALVAPLPRPLFGGLPLNASSPETWQVGAAHVCAASGGNLYCWGDNAGGQLGDGSRSTRAQPVQITLPAGTINRVTAGRTHTCVDIEGEGLYCWGTGGNGRLGDGTRLDRLAPVRVQDP